MRIVYALVLIVFPFMPAAALPCAEVNQRLEALAKRLSVRVDHPTKLSVGQREAVVTVHWSVDGVTVSDDTPTYFILSASEPVRFLGAGFLALTTEALGPTGVDFGSQHSRAIVPLHNPAAPMRGAIALKALHAGATELQWGLVAPSACGQRIATEDKLILSVSAGAPHLVIQNPYDLDNPDQTVLSNDGRFRLHVFADRFRVFDIETGLLVLETQGREPSLPPRLQ